MAKNKTPHFDEWKRTIGKAGKGVAKISALALKGTAPGITETISQTRMAASDAKSKLKDAKQEAIKQKNTILKSMGGSDLKTLITGALKDLQNGDYSLDKENDDISDDLGDFDDMLGDIGDDYSDEDDEGSSSASISQAKSVAIIGKTISSGNMAQIEGMRHMTNTIGSVTIKSSRAASAEISNAVLLSMNQTTSALSGISGKLDVINQNLVSLVDFQNNTTLKAQQGSIDFMSETSEAITNMSKNIAQLNDKLEKMGHTELKKKDNDDFFSNGFSVEGYLKQVKKNFETSELGSITSMLDFAKSGLGMMSAVGMSPMDLFGDELAAFFVPKNIKKSIARFDNIAMKSVDELLYRLGDSNSFLGSIFGKKRENPSKPVNLAAFKKESMSWNGVAQKTLVEVIPNYLAKIESALTSKDERYFDMGEGKFKGKSTIIDENQKKIKNMIEYGFYDMRSQLSDLVDKGTLSKEDYDKLAEKLNRPILSLTTNPTDRGASRIKNSIYDELKEYLPDNELRNMMMTVNEAITSTTSEIMKYSDAMSSGYKTQAMRNLFNDTDAKSALSFTDLNSLDIFDKSMMFTKDGKRLDEMTEEERQAHERATQLDEKLKGMKGVFNNLKNKFKKDKNKNGMTSKIANNIDKFGNYLYDKAYGFDGSSKDNMLGWFSTDFSDIDLNAPFVFKSLVDEAQNTPNKPIASGPITTNIPEPASSQATINKEKDENKPSWVTEILDNLELNDKPTKNEPPAPKAASSRATTEEPEKKSKIQKDLDSVMTKASKETISSIVTQTASEISSENDKVNRIIEDEAKLSPEETTTDEVLKTYTVDMHHNLLKPIAGFFGEGGRLSQFLSDKHMEDLKHKLFNKEDGKFKGITRALDDKKKEIAHDITGEAYIDSEGNKVEAEKESVLNHVVEGYNKLYSNTMKYIHHTDDENEIKEKDSYKKFFHLFDFKKKRDEKWEKREKEKNAEIKGNPVENSTTASSGDSKVASNIQTNVTDTAAKVSDATDKAADIITESAEEMSNVVFGDFSNPKTVKAVEKSANDEMTKQKSKIMKHKLAAAGVGGAIFGTITGMGGTGILGQFLLPTGPVGGAILGVGASLLSRNEKFMEFLFGEKDEDGERTGGVVSSNMQKFVKKNMPLIAGGATLGLLKNMILGSSGGLFGSLLGGPVGAAAMTLSIGLLKNNEKFNNILFGPKSDKDKDNKKFTGRIANAFSKSTHFLKAGGKGAVIGAGAGLAISKMGLLGASLGPAGIIGGAITGLGIGIASQGDKFKEMMFGTEEFDEEGNSKGRRKNGLFHKMQNMISSRVFEPIKDTLDNETTKFAYWLKDNIKRPFQLAFGPILDSIKGIKKDIKEIVHNAFNSLAETIGGVIKGAVNQVLKPFTLFAKLAGQHFASTMRRGTQLALTPLSAGLRLLSMATFKKRMKGKMKEGKDIATHLGDLYSGVADKWRTEDPAKFGKGIGGKINRFLTHGRDLKNGLGAAMDSYEDELKEYGYNSLNWMSVKREKREDAKMMKDFKGNRKKWRKIDEYRRQLQEENDFHETNYNDEKLAKIQQKLAKLGLGDEGLKNNEDLTKFLYHKDDWKSKFDPSADRTSKAYTDKNGIKIDESPEQKKARDKTGQYQQYVMKKFDMVEKNFAIIAARESLKKEKRLSSSQLVNVTKHLKEKGITWEDIGIDPADKIDMTTLSDKEWDKYMKARFPEGKKENSKVSFSEMVRSHLENLANKVDTGNVIAANNAAVEGDLDKSTINKMTGQKFSDSQLSGAKENKRQKSKVERDAKEKEESEEAQSGGISYQEEEDKEKEKEAEVPDLKETKDTVFDSIKDFFSDKFGGASFKSVASMAVGGSVALLFGKEIMSFAKSAIEVLSPLFKKALSGIGKWWDENGEKILTAGLNRVKDNMAFIISNVASLSVNALETAAKMAVNALTLKFGGFKWFKDVDGGKSETENYGTTYDSVEEANANASAGDVIHANADGTATKMGKRNDVDAEGNVTKLGNADYRGTAARGVLQYGRSRTFRWLANKSVKLGGIAAMLGLKTAGWISGITPGFKAIKGGINLAQAAGSGIANIGKGIHKARLAAKAGEKAANEGTEAVVEGAAKNAAEEATKEGSEAVIENAAEKATKESSEAVIEKTAKEKTEEAAKNKVVSMQDFIEKKAAKEAKVGAEDAAKDAAEETIKKNAEKAAKDIGEDVAAKKAGEAASRKGISNILKKAKTMIEKVSGKVKKYIPENKFKKWIAEFITKIGQKLASADNKLVKKIGEKIIEKTSNATVRTASDATIILGIGFGVYDAINGFISASYLFGVKSSDVDIGMRTVSSIMEVLLGTGAGAWIDIILTIYGLVTGTNPKQEMARTMYKFVSGNGEKLDTAVSKIELEAAKYNSENGTKLSADAYNEKVNGHRTIGGRIKQGFSWLASRGSKKKQEAYNKKYNFKQYSVSDQEAKGFTNYKKTQGKVDVDNTTLASDYLGGNTVNGPGQNYKSKIISYGDNTLSQSDPRWGNINLGKFPNGTDSTMATGGCGPTAFAMAMNALGKNVSPAQAAQYAKSNGYIQDGGSTSGLFENGGKDAGVSTKKVNKNTLKSSLKSGDPVLISGKSTGNNGPYTEAGHIVMASGVDSNGNAIVNDPMRGKVSVDIGKLSSGMTDAWSYSNVGGGSKDIYYGKKKKNKKSQTASSFVSNKNGMPTSVGAAMLGKKNKKNTTTTSEEVQSYASSSSDDVSPITKLMAVGYANMSALMGGDYNEAKNKFLSSLSTGDTTDETTTTDSTTTSDSDLSAATIKGSGVAKKAWNYFKSKGYSDAAIAGILGNGQQESGLNPKSGESNGPAHGIWQWESSRFEALKNAAKKAGVPWTNADIQIKYLASELENPSIAYFGKSATYGSNVGHGAAGKTNWEVAGTTMATLDQFKNSTDPDTAARQFEAAVERASWPRMDNRVRYAKGFMKKYGNSGSSYGFGRRSRAIGYGGNWLATVQAVKAAYAKSGTTYHADNSHMITISLNGKTRTVRPDCSGFVSACLQFYGSLGTTLSSSGFVTLQSLKGFTKAKWPGWENLQPGDIIAMNGHVEIYAGDVNGTHKVYNAGSTSAIQEPGITNSSHSSYTIIWRPNEAGNISSLATSDIDSSSATVNTSTSESMNASSTPLDSLFGNITNLSTAFDFGKMLGFGEGPDNTRKPKSDSPEAWFTNTLDGRITSGYGKRETVLGNEYHKGIDIASTRGKSIKSPINGTIVSKGTDVAGYGNYAVVRDGRGNNHLFAHMDKPIGYGIGDSINRNDVIGEVGSTGKSTGDHLHYEIRKNGNKYSAIDPSNYRYDKSVNSNLNISKSNVDNAPSIGSGEKDISTKNLSDKLNIALNTDNVEDKLDTLIEVMKTWADKEDKRKANAGAFNQVNNTTVNYGNGKTKQIQKTHKRSTDEIDDMSLAQIHKMIASK